MPTHVSAVLPPTFARTKIQPPRPRTQLLARAPLERQLGEALHNRRLTLLSAPAGYGKTAALTRVLSQSAGLAISWIGLDDDDDLPRLLGCLLAALEPFDLPWRRAPEALAAAAGGSPAQRREATAELLNTLAASELPRGVMVFDDLHRISDPAVFDWLDQLLERLSPQWGVAIASRVDPPLALARLRAHGELAELRQPELQFSRDEVAALLTAQGGEGQTPAADALYERTQGWAAGLRLSLSARSASAAGAGNRVLFDYLASEVLDEMPSELRMFLLRCSVLPELTAARCAAVSGDARAAYWLDEIERRGLFISVLAGDELTLRLHDLFRDFLEDRLQRELPGELPELLQRAAAGETDPVRRIGLLLRAGAHGPAQQALLESTPALLVAGATTQLLRLIQQFPAALRDTSPLIAFVRGLIAWPRFEWVTMQAAMQRAAAGFAALGLSERARQAGVYETVALSAVGRLEEASAQLRRLRAQPLDRDTEALAELTAMWESGARGPAAAPAAHLRLSIELLERGATPQLWYRCAPHFMLLGRPGINAAIERYVGHALAVAGESHAPLRAVAHTLVAWLRLWEGRPDDAQAMIRVAEDEDRWLGQPRNLRVSILSFRAAWHLLRGEREGMNAACDAMVDDVDRDPERHATWRGVYVFMAGRLAASLEDWPRAQAMATMLGATPADREWPFMVHARRTLSGLLSLRQGRVDETISLLQPSVPGCGETDFLAVDASLRMLLARALLRAGRADEAWNALAPAVELALTAGGPMSLLINGTVALDELAGAAWPETVPARAAQRLRDWAALAHEFRQPASPVAAPAHDAPSEGALSSRERQVLERIAAGESNKLIARTLDLSPHTVKRHVANILDKLGLASRGQAAAWYRAQA
jgi:LuxR family maltose regulon positive regulatory protein